MTSELSRVTNVVQGLFQQMDQWPVAILLFVSLIIVAFGCRSTQMFPNRFIPITLLTLGVVLNMSLGEMQPKARSPLLILGCRGLFIAFVAVAVDSTAIKKLYKRFPFLNGQNGNGTAPPFKSKDEDQTNP